MKQRKLFLLKRIYKHESEHTSTRMRKLKQTRIAIVALSLICTKRKSHPTSDRSAATGGDGTGGTGGTGPPTVSSSRMLLTLARPRPSTLSSGHCAPTTSEKTGRPMTFAATTLRHQSTARCTTSSDLYEHAPRGCRSAFVRNLLLPYRCL